MHDTSGGKAGQQYTPAGDWIRKRDYDSLAEHRLYAPNQKVSIEDYEQETQL